MRILRSVIIITLPRQTNRALVHQPVRIHLREF
jgi:hypothetical protein